MGEQIAEVHSIEAAAAITTELVACTLGQRQRLELRTDVSGRLTYVIRRMGESMARFKEVWGG